MNDRETYRPRLHLASGDEADLEPTCLIVWIDETGHELLADPGHPVFGLGGCASLAGDYLGLIANPLKDLKQEYFDPDEPLHGADMHGLSSEQISALADFLRKTPFGRVAALVSSETQLPKEIELYQLTASVLRERINDLLKLAYPEATDCVLVFEDSERTRAMPARHFGTLRVKRRSQPADAGRPLQGFLYSKASVEPGLEVADLIMHTAGAQVRTQQRPRRRDFEAIFGTTQIPEALIAYREVVSAAWTETNS